MKDVVVSVHQPNFQPWLRLLDKILASDVYVAFDTVQYTKSEYHARQKIKTPTGPMWLSVPVRHVRGVQQLIQDVRIENAQPFRRQHLRRLRLSYGSMPYFDEIYPILEEVYGRDQEKLADLNLDIIKALCEYLETPVRIVRASTLPHSGDTTQRLVQLVQAVGGTTHLTSTYGTERRYVDWTVMHRAGLRVEAQMFEHPVYEQIGDEFIANLAAIDMLFSCGTETAEILAGRRRHEEIDVLSAVGSHA
ncbi:WbqC family protein [Phytoactinopolyspora mesophila]|uniref:WbqC family protein n=1 Tax=Phytoactinopolyspora mesophila TaxID=2650750 RepID=A0A7K3M8M3_9ACTN|nr:WbqC family protein [Phytoactinopolyspora mesophila]NDL59655.1 hypothetical protein [Phytoactinopolyspora mesophila]